MSVLFFSGNMMAQTKHVVEVTSNVFTPKTVKINKGDTVEWRNIQGFHNVNGKKSTYPSNPVSFGNSTGVGWTYSFVFTVPGKYDYVCDPHVAFGMVGVVEVTGDGGNKVVINCPANQSISACKTQQEIDQAFKSWLNSVSASGGCAVNITNNAPASPALACVGGATTVKFTATPVNGFDTSCKTTSCTATFTVEPADEFILTCPENVSLAACQSQADIDKAFQDWLNTAGTTGGCNVILTNDAPSAAPLVCEGGTIEVIFTAKDSIAGGEVCTTKTCTATFTVEASEKMVLTCPSDQTEIACQTQADLDKAYTDWLNMASVSGGCNASITHNAPATSPLSCEGGSVSVTFKATNLNADGEVCSSDSCTATFTVISPETLVLSCPTDTSVISCQDETVINTMFQDWLNSASASGGCNVVITNDAPGSISDVCKEGPVEVVFTATANNADGVTCSTQTCKAVFTLKPQEPPKLTVNFSGMNPHVGQTLWLSLTEKNTGKEIVRKTETVAVNFEMFVSELEKGLSYVVDFYVDHNKNGRYDMPPADHAWSLEINNVKGDTTLNFSHNTNFTDIMWKNKLIINFENMNPHLGQNLWLAVIEKESGEELARVNTLVQQEFSIETFGIEAGKSYYVNFFSDHNKNGKYDSPNADHAWQLELNDVRGDTTLNFSHNTNFTDIMWKNRLTVHFTGMNPHVGQNLWLAVIDKSTGVEIGRLNTVIEQDFMVSVYGIEMGMSYSVDFFADHNGSRTYDAPPVDHAWRLDLDNVSADTTLNFSHNVNFTDINLSTGIDDLPSFMDEIKLYPNPVKHNVFVSFNNAEVDDFTLGIFNPAGVQLRRIAQKHIGFPIDIDVSDFESGLYFIKVETSNQKGVFKFIKQ